MLALAEAALTAGKTAVRYGVASLGLDQASGVAAAAPWPWIIENRVQP